MDKEHLLKIEETIKTISDLIIKVADAAEVKGVIGVKDATVLVEVTSNENAALLRIVQYTKILALLLDVLRKYS